MLAWGQELFYSILCNLRQLLCRLEKMKDCEFLKALGVVGQKGDCAVHAVLPCNVVCCGCFVRVVMEVVQVRGGTTTLCRKGVKGKHTASTNRYSRARHNDNFLFFPKNLEQRVQTLLLLLGGNGSG